MKKGQFVIRNVKSQMITIRASFHIFTAD